ncbi:Ldh family oxidoreductase [Acetobacter oeni]|uniref:Oxidoreductase n=1 Tax=Acetobacter oeni TaxID=304077 RepID=A0A511XMA7_9PROT|nr:Ldh family oxidoreductase [Acetobacter oeni]MBB3884095.1 LDH2 family malate/lactate/ureidoglycolate dehydrogenase [Acetobacter oeni]NHO20100.1 Ldh family oxidoreductase [Acetobacter oeni]GBR02544.1 malate/L-lactate dehydrogenase [Acetobacter oeni LMG 21952]GEN64080.1 oxidoreductase [Acetobacter oeni]
MSEPARFPEALLRERCETLLTRAGASPADASAITRALLHASLVGVDSHGVRLIPHYTDMLRSGAFNPTPNRTLRQTAPAAAMLDADNGPGHPASYEAMTEAVRLATKTGIGAVGVFRSSHFGAAGAYALAAAEQGLIGIVTTNSDSAVCLFGGAVPFHGTNPIAMAAPVAGANPWVLDMATSSIPFNRVKLFRSLGKPLPPGVAVDTGGHPTQDPEKAAFLQPLGGEEYGFKGAALAGVVAILSAVLTGAAIDPEMAPTDAGTAQNVGHFFIAIDPEHFVGRAGYDAAMTRYLTRLRGSTPVDPNHPVMAPGDREWKEAADRTEHGIPVDPDTMRALGLSSH